MPKNTYLHTGYACTCVHQVGHRKNLRRLLLWLPFGSGPLGPRFVMLLPLVVRVWGATICYVASSCGDVWGATICYVAAFVLGAAFFFLGFWGHDLLCCFLLWSKFGGPRFVGGSLVVRVRGATICYVASSCGEGSGGHDLLRGFGGPRFVMWLPFVLGAPGITN